MGKNFFADAAASAEQFQGGRTDEIRVSPAKNTDIPVEQTGKQQVAPVETTALSDTKHVSDTDAIRVESVEKTDSTRKASVKSPKKSRIATKCEKSRLEISIPSEVKSDLQRVSAHTGMSISSLLVSAWYGNSMRDRA